MLIPSDRHTAEDLRFWAETEAADEIAAKHPQLRERQASAMQAIIDFVLNRPPAYCCVSWGKDSIVVAHLMRCIAPHVPLVHLSPSNDNPDSARVASAYLADFPGQPYFVHPVNYGAERNGDRTERIWLNNCEQVKRNFGGRWITGIRQDESATRRIRVARWGESTENACAPICRWSTQDVFAYLAWNSLPIHPAYAMSGGGRWPRERLRVDVIGDSLFGERDRGYAGGRAEWEQEYYGDVLRRLALHQ